MTNYILVEASRILGNYSQAMYSYDDEILAVSAFHQKLGGAMKNEDYDSEMVMVVDEFGAMIKCERFDRIRMDEASDDIAGEEGETHEDVEGVAEEDE